MAPVAFGIYVYINSSSEQVVVNELAETTQTETQQPTIPDILQTKSSHQVLENVEAKREERLGYQVTTTDKNLAFLKDEQVEGRTYLDESDAKKVRFSNSGHAIRLKGATFTLDPNHTPLIVGDNQYIYLQLSERPNKETMQALHDVGVMLNHFVDRNTWLVNVTQEQVDQLTTLDAIHALGDRAAKDKISPSILSAGIREKGQLTDDYAVLVEVLEESELPQLEDTLIAKNLVSSRQKMRRFGQNALVVDVVLSNFQELTELDVVAWIENKPGKTQQTNTDAAAMSNVDDIANEFRLDGNGIVMGIWDAGNVDDHVDFGNRVTNRDNATADEHATHVAGTMLGNGAGDPRALGMAPSATLNAYDWNSDNAEMRRAANDLNVVISNHSYGTRTGWFLDNGGWSFLDNQDEFGRYDAKAREWDDIVEDTGLLIVKAAGNDRGEGSHMATNSQPTDGGDDGYDSISTYGNAKNIITVGSLDEFGDISDFSSRGPADDGRIKPDLVANGERVFSTILDNGYGPSWGTSMASPVVSGASALISQRFTQVFGRAPQASMTKALLLHSAQDLGNPGPDYDTGWGLLDAQAAVDLINQGARHFSTERIFNGMSNTDSIIVHGGEEQFKVTIAWTDRRGPANGARSLVNDMDIRLVSPSGVTYFPWVKDANNPANAATRGNNDIDNVEQIVVNNPEAGEWSMTINGTVNRLGRFDFRSWQTVSVVTSLPVLGLDSDNDW